jgi:hypothetical protein
MRVAVTRKVGIGAIREIDATGADGSLTPHVRRPGPTTVSLEIPGGTRTIETDLYAGWLTEVEIPAPGAGATVRGRITDARSGDPVRETPVRLRARRGFWLDEIECETGLDGAFALEGVDAGPAILSVLWNDGHDRREIERSVVVPESGELASDFLLGVVVVRGVVTAKSDGAPIAGARVVAVNAVDKREVVGITGPAGEYELTDLGPGPWSLTAKKRGFRPVEKPLHRGPEPPRVDFQLVLAATVRIRLRGRTGTPVPDSVG